ncbi:MAG: 50S ribosomal protein L18 [Deltaproteobacteria bacterium]|nr:50S ribosomal protein L18 [Deltaproteobacteria bacterium]
MTAMSSADSREKRKRRVRKKVRGTPESPRLTVFRSSKNIYAQIIDDISCKTLVDASSLSKDASDEARGKGGNREGAVLIGKMIAERAIKKGIKKVVFDRNGFLYHGRIKALADAAREGGLEF